MPTNKFGRERDLYTMKRADRVICKEISALSLIHTNGNIDTQYRSELYDVVVGYQHATAKLNDVILKIKIAKKKGEWW
jgi:hypothetical protein